MALEYVEIGSKYRRPRNLDRELIAFRRLMRKRNHKKRHSVNKEKSHTDRQKAARAKQKRAAYTTKMQTFQKLARAYWTGVADEHP
jgi:hypothetical protein